MNHRVEPSQFYLFTLLKYHLCDTQFSIGNDITESTEEFRDEPFFKTGIQKLQNR